MTAAGMPSTDLPRHWVGLPVRRSATSHTAGTFLVKITSLLRKAAARRTPRGGKTARVVGGLTSCLQRVTLVPTVGFGAELSWTAEGEPFCFYRGVP